MKTSKAMLHMFLFECLKGQFDCSASVKPFTDMQPRKKVLKCL